MGHVFITRAVPGDAIDLLRAAGHEIDQWPGELPPSRDALHEHLREADGALTMVTDAMDADLFAACPQLRILANMAVGFDNLRPAEAAAAGIWTTNTPGVLAETTADFTWALMMSAARRVTESAADTLAGGWNTWSPTGFLGSDLYGGTLGIVGMGEIGTAVARRARGFGMRILYTSRTRRPAVEATEAATWVPLEELLVRSDYVSVHTPLTPETRHLFGAREFAGMKPTALFVNTARGGVVDQDALVAALRAGRPGGAALDVTDPEPLPLDHPLYRLPNVLITPHIASASLATRSRMARMAAENIIEVLAGRPPLHPVNRPERPRAAR